MDFSLNEEQQQARKMVRDFAQKEVIPVIGEWDRKQEMNPAFLPRMAELGIMGICIPVRYGGQGFAYALVPFRPGNSTAAISATAPDRTRSAAAAMSSAR